MSRRSIKLYEAYLASKGRPVPKAPDIGVRCWRPKPEPANDAELERDVPEDDSSRSGPQG